MIVTAIEPVLWFTCPACKSYTSLPLTDVEVEYETGGACDNNCDTQTVHNCEDHNCENCDSEHSARCCDECHCNGCDVTIEKYMFDCPNCTAEVSTAYSV